MAEIAGLVLTVLPAVAKTAIGIQNLVDHYNNAPKYVQELHTQCTQARQQLARMRDSDFVGPPEADPVFHGIIGDVDKRLELFLQKLNSLKLGSYDDAGAMSRIRAIMSRQEMMDMRQYILERNAEIQISLLYVHM